MPPFVRLNPFKTVLSRTLHTVRYLKPIQVYGRLFRRRPSPDSLATAAGLRAVTGTWKIPIPRHSPRQTANRFRFLNQERDLRSWNDAGIPKLWLYNLHYFEYCDAGMIERWVAENPAAHGNGWEPYPLSLRITNWIKWRLGGNSLTAQAQSSLAQQSDCLSRTVEHHLQANHLLTNAKALVFAGAAFEGSLANRWLAAGLEILRDQVPEQVLADGGHFERSPMYHSLILEDLLDLINLSAALPNVIPAEDVALWSSAASRMLGWLEKMCHPDGRISFFNDAAFAIAPEPFELHAYACRLGLASSRCHLGESGYIRLENHAATVLFDAASIGPDYQPGHAHADTLSFELSGSERLLVNSGTSTYEVGPLREAQRSTAAHNTATVDNLDSSEVWRGFRVARRARPFDIHTNHLTYAEASHSGYHRLAQPVTHRRRLELGHDALRITDTFEGSGTHDFRLFFHLHPNARLPLQLDPRMTCSEQNSHWYPEFNRAVPNRTVVGFWSGPCPASFTTVIPL